ncbi:hypothetical protein [Nitrosopumilus ureiphilus]|uniref:Uncharacterized protein n=1 Tax=Nitrosopumilus ureiphilus TaxID=1470067 RepID=A0A7D5RG84_9ARCH|nr:hypothetical protein [Nitrosopumilus ureiphilus]QLH06485.1 hypothetical protein C5F50_04920 [Nitrosopumilus ureiphilus]
MQHITLKIEKIDSYHYFDSRSSSNNHRFGYFCKREELTEEFSNLLIFYYGVDNNEFIFSVAVQIGIVLVAVFMIRR